MPATLEQPKNPQFEFKHPRGADGKFIKKGSAEAHTATVAVMNKIKGGDKSQETQHELLNHLLILNHAQLVDLKKHFQVPMKYNVGKDVLIDKISKHLTGQGAPQQAGEPDIANLLDEPETVMGTPNPKHKPKEVDPADLKAFANQQGYDISKMDDESAKDFAEQYADKNPGVDIGAVYTTTKELSKSAKEASLGPPQAEEPTEKKSEAYKEAENLMNNIKEGGGADAFAQQELYDALKLLNHGELVALKKQFAVPMKYNVSKQVLIDKISKHLTGEPKPAEPEPDEGQTTDQEYEQHKKQFNLNGAENKILKAEKGKADAEDIAALGDFLKGLDNDEIQVLAEKYGYSVNDSGIQYIPGDTLAEKFQTMVSNNNNEVKDTAKKEPPWKATADDLMGDAATGKLDASDLKTLKTFLNKLDHNTLYDLADKHGFPKVGDYANQNFLTLPDALAEVVGTFNEFNGGPATLTTTPEVSPEKDKEKKIGQAVADYVAKEYIEDFDMSALTSGEMLGVAKAVSLGMQLDGIDVAPADVLKQVQHYNKYPTQLPEPSEPKPVTPDETKPSEPEAYTQAGGENLFDNSQGFTQDEAHQYGLSVAVSDKLSELIQTHKITNLATGKMLAKGALQQLKAQFPNVPEAELAQEVQKQVEAIKASQTGNGVGTPEAQAVTPSGQWLPDTYKEIKNLGGSTGARLVEDANGKKYVAKKGSNPGHVTEEWGADKLYATMGYHVPKADLVKGPHGGPVKIADWVEGDDLGDYLAQNPAKEKQVFKEIGKGFAMDALLGNWDVVGMSMDNIKVGKDGKVYRIDNGGSLRYRAQGALKTGGSWGPEVKEIETLRHATTNPQTAKVYGHLTDEDIKNQVIELVKNKNKILAAAPATSKDMLAKRLDWLDKNVGANAPKPGTVPGSIYIGAGKDWYPAGKKSGKIHVPPPEEMTHITYKQWGDDEKRTGDAHLSPSLQKHTEEVWNSLPKTVQSSLRKFTTGYYLHFNAGIREAMKNCPETLDCLSPGYKQDLERIEKGIAAYGQLKQPITVWRKITLTGDDLEKFTAGIKHGLKTGEDVRMPGVKSCMTKVGSWHGNVVMEIRAKTGFWMRPYTQASEAENEFTQGHNTRYRVTGIKEVGGNTFYQLEEI